MIISKEEYDDLKAKVNKLTNELRDLQRENSSTTTENRTLKSEISAFKDCLRQAEEINSDIAEENGCKIGIWCRDCIHSKNINSLYYNYNSYYNFDNKTLDCGYYCVKHIHETCPNWESKISK